MRIKFYQKNSGRLPVKEFIQDCSDVIKENFQEAYELLEQGINLSMPYSRNLSSISAGLHELRLKDIHGQVRVFYYLQRNDAIYFIHAFHKKTQAIPKIEIETVLKRIKEL